MAINTKAQKAELVVQTGHSPFANSVAFGTDGKILAGGSGDATIKLRNVETGKEEGGDSRARIWRIHSED